MEASGQHHAPAASLPVSKEQEAIDPRASLDIFKKSQCFSILLNVPDLSHGCYIYGTGRLTVSHTSGEEMSFLRSSFCSSLATTSLSVSISVTYSECVSVASIIQLPKRMRRIILSSVACPGVLYFHTISHKRPNFRKENYCTNNDCLIFSTTLCEKRFSF